MFLDNYNNNEEKDDLSVVDEDILDKYISKFKANESLSDVDNDNEIENEEKKEDNDIDNIIFEEHFNPFKLFIKLHTIDNIPTNLGSKYIILLLLLL